MPVSTRATTHFDALMHGLLPLIEGRLLEAGEVEPFGVTLNQHSVGEIVMTRSLELAVDKLQFIVERLREQALAGEMIACLLVTDVDVANPQQERVSAIRCSFEDADGSALEYFIHYERPIGTEVVYGEPFVMARAPTVFTA